MNKLLHLILCLALSLALASPCYSKGKKGPKKPKPPKPAASVFEG